MRTRFCGIYEVCLGSDQCTTKKIMQLFGKKEEVRALNSIFQEWKISPTLGQWNISGEPCTGAAIDNTSFINMDYNPFIKCECSYKNGTVCHILELKVYELDVVGVLPDELWTLTFLTNLDLRQNFLTGPIPASIGNLTGLQYLSFGINALSGKLPKELGKLTNLLSLAFGFNNFSGPLPSELGNLTKLQQFDSIEYNISKMGDLSTIKSIEYKRGTMQWSSHRRYQLR